MEHRADPAFALFEQPSADDDPYGDRMDPQIEILSTTVPVSAERAFELFCDLRRAPEWVSVVRSVQILAEDSRGYPTRVAFLAVLERATIGYTLTYRPNPDKLSVSWESEPDGSVIVRGRAEFSPLGPKASMLHYQLQLDVPAGTLPSWGDPFFDGHAASAVIGDFRDFVHRSKPI
jgi:uncharacterized membrane protein